jgi:hypothetical protein
MDAGYPRLPSKLAVPTPGLRSPRLTESASAPASGLTSQPSFSDLLRREQQRLAIISNPQLLSALGLTGLAGLSRPTPGVEPATPISPKNSALRIEDYPRPPQDNGRGLHWIPTLRSDQETVDRFVKAAVDMKAKWVVFLNDGTKIGDNDYLVSKLVANGIMPIMRIYTPNGRPIQGDVEALVRHYRALGVQYYQLYNEPNLREENEGRPPSVNRYLDLWIPAAEAVVRGGGLPGFGALAPGGDYDDLQFLSDFLDGLKARGRTDLLDRAWVALHNYSWNRPNEFSEDSNGFLKFRWYDRLLRQKIGRSLPIISTEGGAYPGNQEDPRLPPNDEATSIKRVLDSYLYMRQAEPYYFAYTYWVLANDASGLTGPWSHQALYRNGQWTPLAQALMKLS